MATKRSWESSFDESKSSHDRLDESRNTKDKKLVSKRPIAEEKLQEKRLKERARRNGMAQSIDEMRRCVPYLKESSKVYSQAKVVAIALQHIYELQRENAELRSKVGLPVEPSLDKTAEDIIETNKAKRGRLPKRKAETGDASATTDAAAAVVVSKRRKTEEPATIPSPIRPSAPPRAEEISEDGSFHDLDSGEFDGESGDFPNNEDDDLVFGLDPIESDDYVSESDSHSPTLAPGNPFSYFAEDAADHHFARPQQSAWGYENHLGYSPIDSFGLIHGSPQGPRGQF